MFSNSIRAETALSVVLAVTGCWIRMATSVLPATDGALVKLRPRPTKSELARVAWALARSRRTCWTAVSAVAVLVAWASRATPGAGPGGGGCWGRVGGVGV